MEAPTPPESFRTERLTLRRPRPDDAVAMFEAWATDPEVTRYLTWRPHETLDETRAHIERCRVGWEEGSGYVWFLATRGGAELVGSLAARPGRHGVNLGYLVARPHWGRGYMTEALEPVVEWWLARPHVYRVWAVCDVDNPASARVLEKVGFRREGVLRRWELHPNVSDEPRDPLCFSRVVE